MIVSMGGSSQRESSSSSSSLESPASSSSDDDNVEFVFPPPPPTVVSSPALAVSGYNDSNRAAVMSSGYRGLSAQQQMMSGSSSASVPSTGVASSSSTVSSSGGFGASIAAALEQRKRDREEQAQAKRQQRREEERQNPDLVKKDKEVGVFITTAYRDATRHRLLPSSSSSPSTKEQTALEFSSGEECVKVSHHDAVLDSRGASNAHGDQKAMKSNDESDENPLDNFIKALEASGAKEVQAPVSPSSSSSGDDHTAFQHSNEGSKVHVRVESEGEAVKSRTNEPTRSETMKGQTSGVVACGRLNSSSAVGSVSCTPSSTSSELILNEDSSVNHTASRKPHQTALQALECAVVERVSRKLLSLDQLYVLLLRSTKRINSSL